MTNQNNQYRTPRERISDDYRDFLSGNFMQPSANHQHSDDPLSDMPLAMIYSPEQTFTDIYPEDEGLAKGTIFSDLYFPFEAVCGGTMR